MGKYFAIFRCAFLHAMRNYKSMIGLSIFLITCLIIFAHLWKITAVKMGAFHLNPDQLLWYIAFNEWVLISLPDIQVDIEQDLRSGRLAYLLPRPISYLSSVLVEGLGILCARLVVLGLVTFAFTWMRVGGMPFGWVPFVATLAIGLLAGCVGMLFQALVGVSAFWVQQVDPFHWIWEKLLFTLGGLMLPLTVYPIWLQKIAHFTHFPAILGDRSALAVHFKWDHTLSIIGILLVWGLLASGCLVLLYHKGLRVVNISGG